MKLKGIESTISLAKPSKKSIKTSKNRAIKTPYLIIDQNHQKYALKNASEQDRHWKIFKINKRTHNTPKPEKFQRRFEVQNS